MPGQTADSSTSPSTRFACSGSGRNDNRRRATEEPEIAGCFDPAGWNRPSGALSARVFAPFLRSRTGRRFGGISRAKGV
jgi:hypothetical protein